MKNSRILGSLATVGSLVLLISFMLPTPALAAPVVTLSPSSGSPGTRITVTGTNFESYLNDTVSIFFGGEKIDTLVVTEGGAFTTSFDVPDNVSPGKVYVTVRDERSSQLGDRIPFVVLEPKIELSPAYGIVGTTVNVSGKGFYAGEAVALHYYRGSSRASLGTEIASSSGEFSGTFVIPESMVGEHKIMAKDSRSGLAEAEFKVVPSLTIGSSSGAIGDKIMMSGAGFGNEDVGIYLNDVPVAIGTTDQYGGFKATFNIPVMESGIYDIKAEDNDQNIARVKFTVVAQASLSQSTGAVGMPLTVSGIGFAGARSITVIYDDRDVATAVTDNNGVFQTTFNVPASLSGGHIITISDGVSTIKCSFTMEAEPPPVVELLLPEDGTKIKASKEGINFDWEDVSDPSGVTYTLQVANKGSFSSSSIVLEEAGLTDSEFSVAEEGGLGPSSKEAPHYWRVRATDGASNEGDWTEARSFYISSSFTLPGKAKNALIGVGVGAAVFFGFWLGRRTAYSRRV
ncbi:MAG: IPT/TIG domain-containing protein [Dehalococcoidales bacterium]|nr:IPT/TIG domain-containing protein [Dehalococcoidales bacterium]